MERSHRSCACIWAHKIYITDSIIKNPGIYVTLQLPLEYLCVLISGLMIFNIHKHQ